MKNKRKSNKKKYQIQKVVMGGCSEWPQQNGFCPNGLIVEEAASFARPLDPVRWDRAEKRTAELISGIQPNRPSENHRNAVASYVQRLVSSCVPCQVFTFGSVPLKTYLPDGDIDLTAFSEDQNLKTHWAEEVRDMLLKEERNEHAEFPIKEVQLIQAEVRIIKCLVDNIVVDISFNQLGGLCTLCFLEEVDNLINRNHLFKRSVILIKAWCFYESRILGAHHGLISTYALETLVLYIFNVFNNSFAGPLEVLYRFLEFFSKFDWSNFCVSLWGPVPINSLPNMAAAPPRKDGGNLLLSQMFLDACGTAYSVSSAGPERDIRFSSKHLNVVDPLRQNNNLGRSVNKGNFYRIRSAFTFGAQQLAKILVCPMEDVVPELDQFFANTWERHGKDCRTDSPILDFNCRELELNQPLAYSKQPGTSPFFPTARTTDSHKDLSFPKQKDYDELGSQMAFAANHFSDEKNQLRKKQHDDIKRTCMMNMLQTNGQTTRQFVRTSSSPELTNMSSEAPSTIRYNVATEKVYDDSSSGSGYSRIRIVPETRESHAPDCFTEETSIRESPSNHSLASGSDNSFGNCASTSVSRPTTPAVSSVPEPNQRFVEQDFVNKLSSAGIQHYGGHAQMPVNLAYSFAPFPPTIQNCAGTIPTNLPAVESDWGSSMNHPNGPFSVPFHQPIRPSGVITEQELMRKGLHEEAAAPGVDHLYEDSAFWIDDQINRKNDPQSEDFCTASSGFSPASPSGSVRTKALSERSWDGKSTKMNNLSRYPLGKNRSSTKNSGATVNKRWEESGESVHSCEDVNDEPKDWAQISAPESVIPSVSTSHFEVNQIPGFEQPQISYQHSMLPFGPLFIHPGSQQGIVHNHAVLPVAYYHSGPPAPPTSFMTMVPAYNLPAEMERSAVRTGHDINLDPSNHEQLSQTNSYDSKNVIYYGEHRDEFGSDIFNSDFASHWKNLNYGRFCQGSQLGIPFPYPSLTLQGTSSVVPVPAHQPVTPAGVSRQYGGEVPKQRNGTGTYIPKPNIIREQQCPSPRRYGGDYDHDRNETRGDRDANWNVVNLKPGLGGRGQPRNYYGKQNPRIDRSATSISQTDRTWDTFQENSNPFYCLSNCPSPSNSTEYAPDVVDYSGYQVHPEHRDRVSSADGAFHPLVMIYPYPHPGGYRSWAENLQFGSVRPEHFVGTQVQGCNGYPNGGAHDREHFEGDVRSHSPDYASSPRFRSGGRV